jgi:hypothetical protein
MGLFTLPPFDWQVNRCAQLRSLLTEEEHEQALLFRPYRFGGKVVTGAPGARTGLSDCKPATT